MSRGPKVDPFVEQVIGELVERHPKTFAKDIRVMAENTLNPLGYITPGLRKVQEIATRVKKFERSPLDASWCIGAQPASFTADDLPFLFELARELWPLGVHFSVREAIWACRLRKMIEKLWPERMPLAALLEGSLYAQREVAAQSTGQRFNTLDIDAELALRPWESIKSRWLYDSVIDIGHLDPAPTFKVEVLTEDGKWQEQELKRPLPLVVRRFHGGRPVYILHSKEQFDSEVPELSKEGKKVLAIRVLEEMVKNDWSSLSKGEIRRRREQILETVLREEAQINHEEAQDEQRSS